MKFKNNAPDPKFRHRTVEDALTQSTLPAPNPKGITLYFAKQCPYLFDLSVLLEDIAKELDLEYTNIPLQTLEDAISCPHPFGVCAVFLNGKFLTYTYETRKRFIKLIQSQQ